VKCPENISAGKKMFVGIYLQKQLYFLTDKLKYENVGHEPSDHRNL
jgi:hypothetical protein